MNLAIQDPLYTSLVLLKIKIKRIVFSEDEENILEYIMKRNTPPYVDDKHCFFHHVYPDRNTLELSSHI